MSERAALRMHKEKKIIFEFNERIKMGGIV